MTEKWTDEQAQAKLRKILEKWPLYRKAQYSGAASTDVLPSVISLFCSDCEKEQWWDTNVYAESNHRTGFGEKEYTCKNCGRNRVRYYYYWGYKNGTGVFLKIGQYPPLEDVPPPELEKTLGAEDFDLYKKALRSRNFNYGIGALAYLRRVVENRMNLILDLLAETARDANFAPEELKKLEDIKGSKRFDDKVTYAAQILPPHLRDGGQNPIDSLHDLSSEGIHARSEAECIEIFDRCKLVFEYVFRELKLRRDERQTYLEALRRLKTKKLET
jgi:hypothetical protein